MFDTANLMTGEQNKSLNDSVAVTRSDDDHGINPQVSRQPNAYENRTNNGEDLTAFA
jgi:hypothetical protein